MDQVPRAEDPQNDEESTELPLYSYSDSSKGAIVIGISRGKSRAKKHSSMMTC